MKHSCPRCLLADFLYKWRCLNLTFPRSLTPSTYLILHQLPSLPPCLPGPPSPNSHFLFPMILFLTTWLDLQSPPKTLGARSISEFSLSQILGEKVVHTLTYTIYHISSIARIILQSNTLIFMKQYTKMCLLTTIRTIHNCSVWVRFTDKETQGKNSSFIPFRLFVATEKLETHI